VCSFERPEMWRTSVVGGVEFDGDGAVEVLETTLHFEVCLECLGDGEPTRGPMAVGTR